jgi:hypothetical protein
VILYVRRIENKKFTEKTQALWRLYRLKTRILFYTALKQEGNKATV